MEFVQKTEQVQNVIVRIEMVGQDLILAASGDDAQRLKRSMRAFKSALAWGMELLNHIGQHCRWPHTVRSEVASRVNEIVKLRWSSRQREVCRWHPPPGRRSALPMCNGQEDSSR